MSQHKFQLDPTVRGYCRCGLAEDNPEHDHMPTYQFLPGYADEVQKVLKQLEVDLENTRRDYSELRDAYDKLRKECDDLKRLDAATMEAYNSNLLDRLNLLDDLNAKDVRIHGLLKACAQYAALILRNNHQIESLRQEIQLLHKQLEELKERDKRLRLIEEEY